MDTTSLHGFLTWATVILMRRWRHLAHAEKVDILAIGIAALVFAGLIALLEPLGRI